jgi:hypothetical protein
MKRMAQRVRSTSRRARVLLAFGLAVVGGVLLLIPANAGASAATDRLSASVSPGLPQDLATTSSSGQAFDGTAAVGALFTESDGKLGTHFCSASVVQSTHGDLAVTAAHCVTGVQGQIVFVPGYANGKSVEDVTGAERLGFSWPVPALVRVIGYPDSANEPIACTNWANKFSSTQLVFDCAGYTDGTSGGPFLADVSAASGDGTIIGVIGGYEQGGNLPQVSYAAAFGPATKALFQTAEAAG